LIACEAQEAGIIHDWRNLGSEEAKVALEIEPAARFEEMIRNFFGLAQDGKTSAGGMPRLLQLVLLARALSSLGRSPEVSQPQATPRRLASPGGSLSPQSTPPESLRKDFAS
jgi:hypothetical protein